MATKIPAFTYTGESSAEMKGDTWYIYLKSSGTLTFDYKKTLEACVVGGGAGGEGRVAATTGLRTHGGGGGSVVNQSGILAAAGTGYSVVIGSGGAAGGDYDGEPGGAGGASSAFGVVAEGGVTPEEGQAYGDAGKDGAYAFGDSSLARYGGGGGSGASERGTEGASGGAGGGGKGGDAGSYSWDGGTGADAEAGGENTGGGGGGWGSIFSYKPDGSDIYKEFGGGSAAAGGSGIVILRGTEDDFLPVRFDGVQLSKILFNGEEVTGLVYGGTRIFARMLRRMRRAFEGRRCAYGV